MKKWTITALIAATALISATAASAATNLTLIVNGQVANAETKLIDGVTYVPLRAVAELLGATVNFDATTYTITIIGKDAPAVTKKNIEEFDVNVIVESGPMVMRILKVILDPAFQYDTYYPEINAVVFEVEVENTSNEIVGWFPGYGEIVTNTKEQVRGNTYDTINGQYKGKVVKRGKIIFEVESDLSEIRSLNYFVDAAYDDNYSSIGEDKAVEIILDK